MKTILILLLTLGVNFTSHAFPYLVNRAAVHADQVNQGAWTNFIWTMNAGSDQSFVYHTSQQGISRIIMRFGEEANSTNYLLQWESNHTSLTSTGTIFQGYLSRTNLPPNRNYHVEFIGLLGTNIDSAGSALGKGRVTVTASLFNDDNWDARIIQHIQSSIDQETDPVYLSQRGEIDAAIAGVAASVGSEASLRILADQSLSNAIAGITTGSVTNNQWMPDIAAATANMATNGQWNASVAGASNLAIAVSTSLNARIVVLETGSVTRTVYEGSTSALWSAIGGIVSADNALTNVVGDGRITTSKTGSQAYVQFDSTGLGTGTLVAASLAPYITGAEASNRFATATNAYLMTRGGTMTGNMVIAETSSASLAPSHTISFGVRSLNTSTATGVLYAATTGTPANTATDLYWKRTVAGTGTRILTEETGSNFFYLASNPMNYATGGAWNASVQGASNLALAVGAGATSLVEQAGLGNSNTFYLATNPDGFITTADLNGLGTDTTARAWAQAGSNLAAFASANLSNTPYAVNGQNITGRWFAVGNTASALNEFQNAYDFIGGGFQNTNHNDYGVIGGGVNNRSDSLGFVGGGAGNTLLASYGAIAGGNQNSITAGTSGFIGGGFQNIVSGDYGTIPGGFGNQAGLQSFAAGVGAKATNAGSFVWASDVSTTFGSRGDNTFNVRSVGGMYFLTPGLYMSDTNGVQWASFTPDGGAQFSTNTLRIFPNGDMTQSVNNASHLGILSAQSLTLDGDTITDFSRFATGAPLYAVDLTPYATGSPIYEIDLTPYATGTPVYSVAGLATGTPLYEVDLTPYATGTPVYSIAGLATGTPLYEVDLSPYATGTPVYSLTGLATGTPLYEVDLTPYATGAPLYEIDLTPYATGTPIYSVAGLATGVPLYEIDLAPYATGTPLYAVDFTPYATGAPLYEIDLTPYATGTPIYSVSGLATGTPIYDVSGLATGTPLYEIDLTPYATGTPIYSVAGLATGTPIYSVAGLATGTPIYEIDLSPYATGTPIYSLTGYATTDDALAIGAGATSLTLQAWATASNAAASALAIGLAATNLHIAQGIVATNAQVTASNALAAANGVGLVTTNLHLSQGVLVTQAVNGVVSVGLVASNAAAGLVPVGLLASNAVPWLSLTSSVTAIVSPSAYKTKASYDAEITNSFRLFSGTVTQDQVGVHNQGFFSTTNLWIPLGGTNWAKFEGKLNVY